MKCFPAYLSVLSPPHMLKTILPSLLFLICLNAQAQNFSYTHYSIREGLAGSNVYAVTQDKEGFMWFATETGVSRFDGVRFKNFTIEDGLPDNEILNFFSDSKGRLWMMPFRKTICYYYKGKLYTQKNDSILRRLQITGNIIAMAEDKEGNLVLLESYGFHLIKGTITKSISTKEQPFFFSAMAINDSGVVNVIGNRGSFYIAGENLVSQDKIIGPHEIGQIFMGRSFFVEEKNNYISLTFYESGKAHSIGFSPAHLNFSILSGGFFSDNTYDGTFIYNSNDSSFKEHHLPGKTIANVFKDNENNLWFCTQREGVYKLNSPFISNRIFNNNNGKILCVHSLVKYKNRLWVGTEEACLFTLMPVTNKIKIETYTASLMGQSRNQTKVLLETKNGDLLIGMQRTLISTTSGKLVPDGAVKDLTPAFDNYILVSTSSGVWLVDASALNEAKLEIPDAIWR